MEPVPKTVFAAVTAALLLTLTACGATEATTETTTGATTAAPAPSGGPRDRTALAECLKEHGVTLPEGGFRNNGGQMGNRPSGGGHWGERPSGEPGPRPSGFPSMDARTREAFQACGGRRQMDDSAFNAFRTCMKDNGAEVRSLRDVNRDDAAIKKALEKCRPLMPSTS